ncbi:MAG: phosphate ABC transporter substrate-binding protein PstS [Pseudonocardia sp.]|nr:phosphate ABC transporter substrate-binding protein PstS [Pseudonocardia sp.]
MNRSTLGRRLFAGSAVLALALTAACGGNDDTSDTDAGGEESTITGTIAGVGASAQGSAQEAWVAGFLEANPDVTDVTYDAAGSGAGRDAFTSGGADFAGSDAYLDEEEIAAATETCGEAAFVEIPGYISPIAVAYNLPGVEALNLSAPVIAQIFNVQITTWNDPAIAALNEGVALPATTINAVHRSDESGTTENFVDYLSQAAPAEWTYEVSGDWPAPGGEAAAQTQGVAAALNASEGSIGYLDASQAGDLGVAAIQVGTEFVAYSPEAAAAAVDAGEAVAGRPEYSFAIDLPRTTTEAGVYPIVLVSYQIACVNYDDEEKANLVKAYFSYIISEEGQATAAENAGSAPISEEQRTQAQTAVDAISAG